MDDYVDVTITSETATINDNGVLVFQLNDMSLTPTANQLVYYRLLLFSMTQGYYATIRTAINDRLVVDIGGTTHTLTLAPGDYNTTRLGTEIVNQFGTIGVTMVCAYSAQTKKLTLTSDTDLTIDYSSTTCEEIIGLATDLVMTATVAVTMHNVVSINSIRAIDIKSNLCETSDLRDTGRTPVIGRVLVTTTGGLIQYENPFLEWRRMTVPRTYITIELLDQVGQRIDNNGVGYSVTIRFNKKSL